MCLNLEERGAVLEIYKIEKSKAGLEPVGFNGQDRVSLSIMTSQFPDPGPTGPTLERHVCYKGLVVIVFITMDTCLSTVHPKVRMMIEEGLGYLQ